MVFISSSCTSAGIVAAVLGGAGIGFTAVSRAASLGELLPSATFHPYGTPAMMFTATVLAWVYREHHDAQSPASTPFFELSNDASVLRLAIAGILVGAGASLGEGCTSGNGIQGLAAMSPASLVFVLTFMAAGVAAATLFGTSDAVLGAATPASTDDRVPYELFGLALALAAGQYAAGKAGSRPAAAALGGAAFSTSLVLSSMPKASRVIGFLDVTNAERGWDPTLMFVMGGALLVAFPLYQVLGLAETKTTPPGSAENIQAWKNRPVDAKTVVGGVLFGAGWGCGGMCPGPGIVNCGAALASGGSPIASLLAAGGVWSASMFATKSLLDSQIMTKSKSS